MNVTVGKTLVKYATIVSSQYLCARALFCVLAPADI